MYGGERQLRSNEECLVVAAGYVTTHHIRGAEVPHPIAAVHVDHVLVHESALFVEEESAIALLSFVSVSEFVGNVIEKLTNAKYIDP